MNFRIRGLPAERFAHLFSLSDAELAALSPLVESAEAYWARRAQLGWT